MRHQRSQNAQPCALVNHAVQSFIGKGSLVLLLLLARRLSFHPHPPAPSSTMQRQQSTAPPHKACPLPTGTMHALRPAQCKAVRKVDTTLLQPAWAVAKTGMKKRCRCPSRSAIAPAASIEPRAQIEPAQSSAEPPRPARAEIVPLQCESSHPPCLSGRVARA